MMGKELLQRPGIELRMADIELYMIGEKTETAQDILPQLRNTIGEKLLAIP